MTPVRENSITNRIRSQTRIIFTVPDTLRGKKRWGYGVLVFTSTFAIAQHLLFVGLFLYWDIIPLAVYNICSVAVWTAAFLLRHRSDPLPVLYVTGLEIVVHVFLCFRYLGWGFGYQYLIAGMVVAPFLLPLRKRTAVTAAAAMTGLLLWGYRYTLSHPPLAVVNAVELDVMSVVNMISGFFILIAGMYYITDIAEKAEADLAAAHAQSESLLHNVLPETIAQRLKTESGTIADSRDGVSVLFADLVGFTPLSQTIPAGEVVDMLNLLFSRFDELADRHGVEKIKTIGDSYMAAAGIPLPRADHAEAVADLALDMLRVLERFNREQKTDLELRIGINSGPAIAGVIGKRRFLYDLWGDTVNTASRMESHGIPGGIHISAETARLLNTGYRTVPRGTVDIKGKGPMETFWLKMSV